MGEPARGDSWRTFEPGETTGMATRFQEGHTLSPVHSGAWSPRFVTETMEELRPELQAIIAEAPWCRPLDEHALVAYLRDMARLERLERWLHENGDRYPDEHDRAGELRDRDLREVGALQRRCMDHRARLGLDPASRARMQIDRLLGGVDVAQAMAALAAAASHERKHRGEHEAADDVGGDADQQQHEDRMADGETGAA